MTEFSQTEQHLINKARSIEIEAKNLRKAAESSRQLRVNSEEYKRQQEAIAELREAEKLEKFRAKVNDTLVHMNEKFAKEGIEIRPFGEKGVPDDWYNRGSREFNAFQIMDRSSRFRADVSFVPGRMFNWKIEKF